ncbi:MAG: adenylate/guanylate cyclase domain-containing protein [Candidatus Dormibacteraceae bacterium]
MAKLSGAEGRLRAGLEALESHDWSRAFELLSAADRTSPLPAEGLEKLADAADWAGQLDAHVDALERAYAAHSKDRNQRRAAMMAMRLAVAYSSRLEGPVASGWRARAERLLADEPECVEQGELAMRQGRSALGAGDPDGALVLLGRAIELALKFESRDLWAQAIHIQGKALILRGEVAAGLGLIDEVTAAAVGGELSPRVTGLVYCWTIAVCRDLADVTRAGEWTEAANRWCERQSISGFPGVCRIHRAELLRLRGALTKAEDEIRRACVELPNHSPAMAGYAFCELGEIRLRVGDLTGAEEAFRQGHQLGELPEPGHSLLLLARDNRVAALASITRALERRPWDRLFRARLLPAKVEITIAAGDLEGARAGVAELEQVTADFTSPVFRAAALVASGQLALTEGRAAEAAIALAKGVREWHEVGAPYEEAQAREALAGAQSATGDISGAELELGIARSSFERLGAVLDMRRVGSRLEAIAVRGNALAATSVRQAFMFTDMVESTSLLEAIGDQAWADVVRWHDQALRALIQQHGGEEVDHAGDGFFVAFPDARDAVDCACAIQRRLAAHRREHGFAPRVRIGVHAAAATRVGAGYRGSGVHQAARIAARAGADEILATASTASLLSGRVIRSDPRPVTLKGIARPVEVVTIEWRT